MKIHVPTNVISFKSIQLLNTFEENLRDEIKRLLNESYQHIKVDLAVSLEEWQNGPAIIQDNASILLPGSRELVQQVTAYVASRDDVEAALNGFTLKIDLRMTKKEPQSNPTAQPQAQQGRKDDLPVFTPIEPRYRFDQMILSDHVKKELEDAMKIVKYKDLIYNDWGFGEIDPVPRSILNFYGEPGTGKTMCAHAIAHSLGKPLLALNYSEIESKFVGEAAKNLQHAFETAQDCDAVLFFDEADSFLGKRIENVTQGAEQALNSLRSQMLIQLEQFPGIVLFATNLVTNFDHAFESRILKHIQFEMPNQEARVAIIRKMLPPRLPLENPFDDDQLMEASALIDGFSGREIKTAILELLLSKAGDEYPVITFDDLCQVFTKKSEEKKELARQEEERLKKKIEKKLKEKAAENQALEAQRVAEEQESTDNASEVPPIDSNQESEQ